MCIVLFPIQLEALSSDNLAEVRALEVREDQSDFVPSVAASIELAPMLSS
jgi:hypothetical protein